MKVLALNCGSSTLKFRLIEIDPEAASPAQVRRLAGGIVERIGEQAAVDFAVERGERVQRPAAVADHGEATRHVLEWLASAGLSTPNVVGHRVVHGGDLFAEPALIDEKVLAAVEALTDLAPLHNAPSLSAIRAARAALGPGVPMVATFDTAFHRTMPERASRYAPPRNWRTSTASAATASTAWPTAT